MASFLLVTGGPVIVPVARAKLPVLPVTGPVAVPVLRLIVSVCVALCALGASSAPVVPKATAAAAAVMDRRTLMASSLDRCGARGQAQLRAPVLRDPRMFCFREARNAGIGAALTAAAPQLPLVPVVISRKSAA